VNGLRDLLLALSVVLPAAGALTLRRGYASPPDSKDLRRRVVAISAATLLVTCAIALSFLASTGGDSSLASLLGFRVDTMSAALLPYAALLVLVIALGAPRQDLDERTARQLLVTESVVLATFAAHDALVIVVLVLAGLFLGRRQLARSTTPRALRVFDVYMVSAAVLFAAGALAVRFTDRQVQGLADWPGLLLVIALMIRKGIVPFHGWMAERFEQGSLGGVLVLSMPQVALYVAVRLVAQVGSHELLDAIGVLGLVTAVYGAGLALVQNSARRMFAYLFMSESALALVGLDSDDALGVTGGLSMWLSSGLALTGFGLTIWALEARRGPLSLARLSGGYEQTPTIANCFLVMGLASVGFPGMLGFVGQELLTGSAVNAYPHVGMLVAVASAFNGITVLRAYFALFGGRAPRSDLDQRMRPRERVAVLILVVLLLVGGLFPGPLVAWRWRAAQELLEHRATTDRVERSRPSTYGPHLP
jgi:NADH-quinone oxidoreductase subunit M